MSSCCGCNCPEFQRFVQWGRPSACGGLSGRLYKRVSAFLFFAASLPAQYIGSQACSACHPAQFASQSKTGHARALARADAGSPGQWAFGAGEKAITYVSQAGPADYLEHGLTYYASLKAMALTPGHANPQDLRLRTLDPVASVLRCFRCHSTGPLRLDAASAIQPSELGVRCESCHGPGAPTCRRAAPPEPS